MSRFSAVPDGIPGHRTSSTLAPNSDPIPRRLPLAIAGLLFLALFAFDGLLSGAEEILRTTTGSLALVSARNVIAWTTIEFAGLIALLCACSAQLPARVYLPPVVATLWFAAGALPLSTLLAPELFATLLPVTQLVIAGTSWAFIAGEFRRSGGFRAFSEARPAFSPKRFAGFAVAAVITLPIVAIGYSALLFASFVETATGGFIDVHATGMDIAEKRYVRGHHEVRLVGMMHVGESSTYDALFDSFAGASTLVLEEGVTDRAGLLSNPLTYGKAAAALGLDTQGSVSEYFEDARLEPDEGGAEPLWPDVRRADVDVSDFSPGTISFIERAGGIFNADDPVAALRAILQNPPSPQEMELFGEEIISMRNAGVLAELDQALREYRHVIVPWGALHLPGIAVAIEDQGFVLVEESHRLLVSWSMVLAALTH